MTWRAHVLSGHKLAQEKKTLASTCQTSMPTGHAPSKNKKELS
jgi:hypothetical protein